MSTRRKPETTEPTVEHIELDRIRVSDHNVRKKGTSQEVDELAQSIKAVGLIQPVEVTKRPGGQYDLIVGQRRYLAHKKLGRKTIRAQVFDKLNRDAAMIRSLVENVHRVELNHADAAKAATVLYKRFGRDIERVCEVTGLSPRRIRQYVYIDELASEKTKQRLRQRKVEPVDVQRTIRAAKGNIEKADELLEAMQKYKLDKYQKGRLVEYGEEHPGWPARKIVEESLKPRIEKSVVVPLSPKLREGLQRAVDSRHKGPDEITLEALEHWLSRNGYL